MWLSLIIKFLFVGTGHAPSNGRSAAERFPPIMSQCGSDGGAIRQDGACPEPVFPVTNQAHRSDGLAIRQDYNGEMEGLGKNWGLL